MKERQLSSVISQLNTILLTANTLMCESGLMENAGKKYGFKLYKEPDSNFESGFHYVARFKHPEDGWNSKIIKSTGTDNETIAKSFAIENRDTIIQEYKGRKENRQQRKKNNGKAFHKMLLDYYQTGSAYLQDDSVNNKQNVAKAERIKYYGFFIRYLIPYLQGQGINSIQDITNSVYSGLKIHLQGKELSTKTINNYLTAFIRVLQYHERNGLMEKLPYSTGNALLRLTKEDKAKAKKTSLLPTDKLVGILQNDVFFGGNPNEPPDTFSFLLVVIGLTTGMRDSEVGRIKREDIKHIKSENAYYLKVFNSKTDFYNKSEAEEYRKIPLHPFIVNMLKAHIRETGKTKGDYLFGNPKMNEDTKQIDGHLNAKRYKKAIVLLYSHIKVREKLQETGNIVEALKSVEGDELRKEMKEKRIVFYSLRHTFQTLLATKYKDQTLLIDYFMGHKPQQAMLANYLHINKVDEGTFWNEYGKLLVDFQSWFIPTGLPNGRKEGHETHKKYIDDAFEANRHLLNEDGTMSIENALDAIINPILSQAKKTENGATDDDFFDSV